MSEQMRHGSVAVSPVLCVDLDGTLLRGDLLHESSLKLFARSPLRFFSLLVRFVSALLFPGGKANTQGRRSSAIADLKSALADQVALRPELLPYREEVLDYIQRAKEEGRKVVLVTASHERYATAISSHLGLFDEVYGTTRERNLKGVYKAQFLEDHFHSFEYLGDSWADRTVWEKAAKVGVVATSARVKREALRIDPGATVFEDPFSLLTVVRMLRVHQWVKNFLLFVPLLMAHQVLLLPSLLSAGIAFVLFSLTASCVYLLNDLVDLENDRSHPTKRFRPLAAGKVSPVSALVAAGFLLSIVAVGLSFLPLPFTYTLGVYLVLTTSYSFSLKRIAVLDIVTLASLYTIRIIAGGAAAGIPVSEWLLAFSLFMFFSLACVKRCSELLSVQERKLTKAQGRGYTAQDLEQIAVFGSVSGYLSILVMALYINSPAVVELYANPRILWLLCPTLLYWVTRVWLLARRGEVHEDPIVFALRDRVSYVVLGIAIGVVLSSL
ncbi:UbiA family prenyltransferase [bacterium]|nr:UbiA family prenyltransferase [bacterium]